MGTHQANFLGCLACPTPLLPDGGAFHLPYLVLVAGPDPQAGFIEAQR